MTCVATFDPRVPSIARVYDFLLGGKDNFAADRMVAQKLLAVYPPIIETVPESRRFMERAVNWVTPWSATQVTARSTNRLLSGTVSMIGG